MSNIGRLSTTHSVVKILKHIREGLLDLSDLSIQDRRSCVAYLRFEGYTQSEIAEIFKVHRQTILRDEKANHREAAKLVDDIDVKSVAGSLIAWASQLRAKAIRQKDYALAWKIQTELVSNLQSLGYLPRSPERHQVQIATFVELVQLATKHVDAQVIEPEVDSKNALISKSAV